MYPKLNQNLISIIRHTFFTLSFSHYHFTSLPTSATFHYRSFHSFVHQESLRIPAAYVSLSQIYFAQHSVGECKLYTNPIIYIPPTSLLADNAQCHNTHAFQLCSLACPQCYASYTAATPDLFVGCLLHCIPLRSPFCR
jgi:hypothetical protein